MAENLPTVTIPLSMSLPFTKEEEWPPVCFHVPSNTNSKKKDLWSPDELATRDFILFKLRF